jgi:single-strand DNA-binding protein
MVSFNSVVLCGHMTRDPELRYTPQGVAVCDFAIAVNRRFTRKDGEKVEQVAFVEVTAWSRLAEIAAEFLKKGRALLVSGHLAQDRWEDPSSGQKRSKLRVVADTLQFLGSGSKDDAAPAGEVPAEEAAAPEDPAPVPPTHTPAGAPLRRLARGRRRLLQRR